MRTLIILHQFKKYTIITVFGNDLVVGVYVEEGKKRIGLGRGLWMGDGDFIDRDPIIIAFISYGSHYRKFTPFINRYSFTVYQT